MRKAILAVLGTYFLGTAQLLAQTSLPDGDSTNVPFAPPAVNLQPSVYCDPYRIWARGEYLLWWVKDAPLPLPLVTTGNPNVGFPSVNSAGAIGQPGTQVLYGNSGANFGAFSGARLALGGWIDPSNLLGLEASGFLLATRSSTFSAGSNAAGSPPLYIPAYNVVAGAERALAVSDPLRGFSGDVSATSTLQLWGSELNGVFNVWRRPGLEVNLLGGFRYANLTENFDLNNTTNDLIFLNTDVLHDHFGTSNNFYGGQIGARVSAQLNRLSLDLTAKLALGVTHETVNIQGDITQFGPGAFSPGTFPGGLFTQPTNIGQRSANEFSVLPAVELKIGYQLTQRLRATVGYDFMYWTDVVRPGNQIDRNINQSQSPIFGGGTLVGQAAPLPFFNRSDFWAQGVSFGLELRY